MNTANKLKLSAWQNQAIIDLEIDAWYLTPLSQQKDKTILDEAHQELIDGLLDTMNDNTGTTPETVETQRPKAQTLPPKPIGSIVSELLPIEQTSPTKVVTKNNRRVLQAPEPIKIDASRPLNKSKNNNPTFPITPIVPDWHAVQQQSEILAHKANSTCYHGEGQRDADDLVIFAPPLKLRRQTQPEAVTNLGLSEREQHLLKEVLASIHLDIASIYQTRLLKHATAFGQDPDDNLLNQHLKILANELALVQPKRIWLFGVLPFQHLLQTDAPLSELATAKTPLQLTFYIDAQKTLSASALCLPPLDYLLAIPSEKGKVWQQLKLLF